MSDKKSKKNVLF